MKLFFSLALLAISIGNITAKSLDSSPLTAYSAEWSNPKYKACNTAEHTSYLTNDEKQVIYILNMVRMNPKLFCKTVLPHAAEISSFNDVNSDYYKSLVNEMSEMAPMGLLYPDEQCFESANCHAVSAGKKGYVGHERQSVVCRKKQHFMGECCQFGISDPLAIVVSLLIDQDTQSLGHRRICLGSEYTKMSDAIAPHKQYGTMTVMDFY